MKPVAVVPSFLAVLVTAAAAAPSTAPQNVRQDVNRLTLLPGPYLTSPAKGAPQPNAVGTATPGMVTIGVEPRLQLVPSTPDPDIRWSFRRADGPDPKKDVAPTRKLQPAPAPETLRFDAQLPSTAKPSLIEKPTPPPPAPPAKP